MLQSMGSQRLGRYLETKQKQQNILAGKKKKGSTPQSIHFLRMKSIRKQPQTLRCLKWLTVILQPCPGATYNSPSAPEALHPAEHSCPFFFKITQFQASGAVFLPQEVLLLPPKSRLRPLLLGATKVPHAHPQMVLTADREPACFCLCNSDDSF